MKKYFFTGLILLLPAALTVWITVFLANLLTDPFQNIVAKMLSEFSILKKPWFFLSEQQIVAIFSKISILGLLVAFLIFLGSLAQHMFFRHYIASAESLLLRIPLISKIYTTFNEAIQILFSKKENAFAQVALVRYPHENAFAVGLISKKQTPSNHDEEVSVFVSGAPNFTAGFMLNYRYEDLIFVDLKVEDVMRILVSCGAIFPDTIQVKE